MDVLTVLTSPALFTDLNLFRLVVGRMAALSLEHGNSDGSCLAYAWLGGILGTYFGDYQAGSASAGSAWIWSRSAGSTASAPASIWSSRVHVAHWTQHLATCRAFLRRAFEAAQEAGDLTYAAYSCADLITNLLASGDPLGDIEREAENALEFVRRDAVWSHRRLHHRAAQAHPDAARADAGL